MKLNTSSDSNLFLQLAMTLKWGPAVTNGPVKALNGALVTVTDAQTIYVMHANIYYVAWRSVIPEEVREGRKNAEETNTSCSCVWIYLLKCFCLGNNSGGYPNVSNVYAPLFCQLILQKRDKSILYFFTCSTFQKVCAQAQNWGNGCCLFYCLPNLRKVCQF